LLEITSQYQRLLSNHVTSSEEKQNKKKPSSTAPAKSSSRRVGLEPVTKGTKGSAANVPDISNSLSAIGITIGAPLPPVSNNSTSAVNLKRDQDIKKLGNGSEFHPKSRAEEKQNTEGAYKPKQSDEKVAQIVELCSVISSIDINSANSEARVATEVGKFFGAARTTLFIVDKEKQEILVKSNKEHKPIKFPIGTGLVGHVAKTGKLVRIPSDVFR
jgi:hypothetical protein